MRTTTPLSSRTADREALKRQAAGWHARLSSGQATEADAEALKRWCEEDPSHAAAFAEVKLAWDVLGLAARNVAARNPLPAYTQRSSRPLARRAFLTGAAAAATAAAAYLVVEPPLDLWPSLPELRAGYRTATGEQRQIAMPGGATVEMNTRTSLNIGTATGTGGGDGAADQVELIAGEAAFSTDRTGPRGVLVVAAGGRVSAMNAKFDIRVDGDETCVTCLDGITQVEHRGSSVAVRQKEQVTYGARGLSQIVMIDPIVVTSWRTGILIFHREPLSHVIAEINRYRPGRIVLVDAALGQRRIDASFRLDRIDDVVPQIEHVFGARVTSLPGGVVLLG